jgi:hypothetical protein
MIEAGNCIFTTEAERDVWMVQRPFPAGINAARYYLHESFIFSDTTQREANKHE